MKLNLLSIFGTSTIAGTALLLSSFRTSNQSQSSEWSNSPAWNHPVLAQMGMGGLGGGGMGGMGGGMGGMGMGMGGMGAAQVQDPVDWQRPEGEEPNWLTSGKSACESIEAVRSILNQPIDFDFDGNSLSSVIEYLSDKQKLEIEVNTLSIEDAGLSLDEPIKMKGAGPLREMLRRILEPRSLAYIVHERSIEIASQDHAVESPTMRCYDLSFVLPDSGRTLELIQSIESSIHPDLWLNAGGNSSISFVGSLLIVSTTESAHQQIEALFYRLSQINQRNLHTPPRPESKPK